MPMATKKKLDRQIRPARAGRTGGRFGKNGADVHQIRPVAFQPPDLLPEPYLKALARLQDKVKPFPYAQVEEIVASELGVRISKAFSYFEEKHLAAASLGQVHRAALRDGRPVVVKVQRPEIRKQIAEDFEVLEEIAAFSTNTRTLAAVIVSGKFSRNSKPPFCRNWIINGKRPI
jgi:hypothetical protein